MVCVTVVVFRSAFWKPRWTLTLVPHILGGGGWRLPLLPYRDWRWLDDLRIRLGWCNVIRIRRTIVLRCFSKMASGVWCCLWKPRFLFHHSLRLPRKIHGKFYSITIFLYYSVLSWTGSVLNTWHLLTTFNWEL